MDCNFCAYKNNRCRGELKDSFFCAYFKQSVNDIVSVNDEGEEIGRENFSDLQYKCRD